MRDRPRTIVTLLIAPDSPLARGRLPKGAAHDPEGILAAFDPVSYGALRASIGDFIPLNEVIAMFEAAIHKKGQPNTDAERPKPSSEDVA